MRYWMLPKDIIELLPDQARQVESLRSSILHEMNQWGYQLVSPPLVEFLDSLLAGSGDDLDIQTFKLTDQISGKLMGVRADFTPQIARIDAHRMANEGVSRFAYCGEVLRTRSESTEPRRNPLIIGAELYGVESITADLEIISLLISIFDKLSIDNFLLDISHSGIYSGLIEEYQLNQQQQAELKDVLTGIKRPDLKNWQDIGYFEKDCINDIKFLVNSPLTDQVLERFALHFKNRNPILNKAVSELQYIAEKIQQLFPNLAIHIDLTHTGNYGYHSGLLFSVFAAGHYSAIARGGRYDGVGEVYGKSRAATGFSIDLLTLANFHPESLIQENTRSAMPIPVDHDQLKIIQNKRAAGEIIYFDHGEDLNE